MEPTCATVVAYFLLIILYGKLQQDSSKHKLTGSRKKQDINLIKKITGKAMQS